MFFKNISSKASMYPNREMFMKASHLCFQTMTGFLYEDCYQKSI